MNDAALLASPLFRGATSEEIAAMLPCLGASPRRFARGERILRAGEPTRDNRIQHSRYTSGPGI